MEMQRVLIWSAVVAVGVMLWSAWQQDYGIRQSIESAQQSTPIISEVPVTELSKSVTENQSTAVAQPQASIIDITTDVLQLKVDLHGGDIIEAALPKYPEEVGKSDRLTKILTTDTSALHTIQSGWVSEFGPDLSSGERQVFTAQQRGYTLQEGAKTLIVDLHWQSKVKPGLRLTKRFEFTQGSYAVKVVYLIDNATADPISGQWYGQIKRKSQESGGFTSVNAYTGAVISTTDKPYQKFSFSDLQKENIKQTIQGGWLAMLQHYFLSAWVPAKDVKTEVYSKSQGGDVYNIGLLSAPMTIAPQQKVEWPTTLYLGPKNQDILKTVAPHLELTVDYGWLWFVAQPLFWLLEWLHKMVNNWGVAIILVTVVIKLLFFKLSATSYRSMAKLKKLQPKLESLKERYGDDRQKFSQAVMELYKKEKVNPLGGCLPILIQIPVFIALYWVLVETVELRYAPFLWISDLSTKDPLYILPLLMGASMFLQQKLSPAPTDPVQANVMKIMPVVFTGLFLFFPAGLVLYWVVNNVLSILQQWVVNRSILAADAK